MFDPESTYKQAKIPHFHVQSQMNNGSYTCGKSEPSIYLITDRSEDRIFQIRTAKFPIHPPWTYF